MTDDGLPFKTGTPPGAAWGGTALPRDEHRTWQGLQAP